MNRLSLAVRCSIVDLLMEGVTLRGVCRMTGISKATVARFHRQVGEVCYQIHDDLVMNLTPTQIQCDEAWTFIRGRERQRRLYWAEDEGSAWVWSAVDRDSKLFVSFRIGPRTIKTARYFLADVKARCLGSFSIVTDGCFSYPNAVKDIWADSPEVTHVTLNPYERSRNERSTTNHVERHNGLMRSRLSTMRRGTNAFAKSHHGARWRIAIHAVVHNFCRVHSALKVSPAMQAGLAHSVWGTDEIIRRLMENEVSAKDVRRRTRPEVTY